MATMKSSGDLISSISADLADNNAGLISAEDVRHNMEDIAFSINKIVASGDTETEFPFFNNVRIAQKTPGDVNSGHLIVESGIDFPNSTDSAITQVDPYPGISNLSHDDLADLTAGDTHTQYVSISGVNAGLSRAAMTGNFVMGNVWVSSSGEDNRGFKFAPQGDGSQLIQTSGAIQWEDGAKQTSAHGVASCWINFKASGELNPHDPVVSGYHNISQLEKLDVGKFKIHFSTDLFKNSGYVAIGRSNARSTATNAEDFDRNTVGIVERTETYCTFNILNEQGDYVDADINDFVAYGYQPSTTASGTFPSITGAGLN